MSDLYPYEDDGEKPSAANLRVRLAEIAPRQAAALWSQPDVISEMNEYIKRIILADRIERGGDSNTV